MTVNEQNNEQPTNWRTKREVSVNVFCKAQWYVILLNPYHRLCMIASLVLVMVNPNRVSFVLQHASVPDPAHGDTPAPALLPLSQFTFDLLLWGTPAPALLPLSQIFFFFLYAWYFLWTSYEWKRPAQLYWYYYTTVLYSFSLNQIGDRRKMRMKEEAPCPTN